MTPHRKRILPIFPLTLVLCASGLIAQQRTYDQDKMKANYAAMLTHSWFSGGGWTVDFAAAKARAKATGKPIFAYFTRTYSP